MVRAERAEKTHWFRYLWRHVALAAIVGTAVGGYFVYRSENHQDSSTVLQQKYLQFAGKMSIEGAVGTGTNVRAYCGVGPDLSNRHAAGNTIATIPAGKELVISDPGVVNARGGPVKGGERCAAFLVPPSLNQASLVQETIGYVLISDATVSKYVTVTSPQETTPQSYTNALLDSAHLQAVERSAGQVTDGRNQIVPGALTAALIG